MCRRSTCSTDSTSEGILGIPEGGISEDPSRWSRGPGGSLCLLVLEEGGGLGAPSEGALSCEATLFLITLVGVKARGVMPGDEDLVICTGWSWGCGVG